MTEKKQTDPPGGVSVTFAREWTIGDKTYQADEDAVLDQADADAVLRFGYARPHDAGLARAYGFAGPSELTGPTQATTKTTTKEA
jgi:hypothetical protein